MSLSPHEKRILDSMEFHKPYFHNSFTRMGFRQGVQGRTMDYLRREGYISITAIPCEGHENDWRETGHYYPVFHKLKHHEEWSYEI